MAAPGELVSWQEAGESRSARWRSASGAPPPRRVVVVDDRISADAAYRLACEGTALLWRGDFQNARQLLQALARRVERSRRSRGTAVATAEAFHRYRLAQAQRAHTLGMLLIQFDADHRIPLRRAPDVRQACVEAFGAMAEPYVSTLRELQGAIGAHEWRKKGVPVPALGAPVHPHYGMFAPTRGEYVDLVARAPLPRDCDLAFDVGTGTGVLAAVLARRGVQRVVATDNDPRALECARDNVARLRLSDRITVVPADLFPEGRATLAVCNPPWIPGRPASLLEHAIYDPDSRMLRGFVAGLAPHLQPGGEGWLVLSDIAEHLGLRTRDQLLAWFDEAELEVLARLDARPVHPRRDDPDDPLHAARAAEVTSLWRLAPADRRR
ncbi:MAG TPA: class I SAM-dependent methyltransferase [Burkholderiaceae bacterium]|nr:class I SAM-dependent methyltransferase [Burkholderiaceae bacterium]